MLKARYGLMPGSGHHEKFTNRQDMCHMRFGTPEADDTPLGVFVGCDGCSASRQSEIGAGLISYFAAERLIQLIQNRCAEHMPSCAGMLQCLYDDILQNLRGLVALQSGGEDYLRRLDEEQKDGRDLVVDDDPALYRVFQWISDTLLFTVVGGYIFEEGAVGFQRGDGGYMLDDDLYTEDHKNMPPYLAYALFPKRKLMDDGAGLPSPGFTSTFSPDASRVAVFSDGMPLQRIDEVWDLTDPLDQWEYRRNRLQKSMRQWFRAGDLHDDLFLGVITRDKTE